MRKSVAGIGSGNGEHVFTIAGKRRGRPGSVKLPGTFGYNESTVLRTAVRQP